MAQNFLPKGLPNLFLVLVLATAIYSAKATDLKETNLSLFFQDISAPGAANATVILVAGVAGKAQTFTHFGTIFVTDDFITESADPNSPEVGRAQGMYVTVGLDRLNSHVMISIVFTNKEYSESTSEIQGVSKQIEVGFARGYATFETYSYHVATHHAVSRCNVTVQHF
jgi:hypothetical protein